MLNAKWLWTIQFVLAFTFINIFFLELSHILFYPKSVYLRKFHFFHWTYVNYSWNLFSDPLIERSDVQKSILRNVNPSLEFLKHVFKIWSTFVCSTIHLTILCLRFNFGDVSLYFFNDFPEEGIIFHTPKRCKTVFFIYLG